LGKEKCKLISGLNIECKFESGLNLKTTVKL
jgi:hypothetical protein